MHSSFIISIALTFLSTSALAGPGINKPAGEIIRPDARISRAAQTTMRAELETSGVAANRAEAERLVDGYVRAGLAEMKPEIIRKLAAMRPEAKTSVNTILAKMTNTVITAKSVTTLGENGKLILEAASKMSTSVVETIANDTSGSVDLAKINDVVTLIEQVSSRNDLSNEGVLLVKINEINAKLGNGRTIRDLKDCF